MVLLIQCEDQKGLVAKITTILLQHDYNIVSLREYVDQEKNRFYARFVCQDNASDFSAVDYSLKAVLPQGAIVNINPNPEKNIAVLVTKEHHCLSDILIRHHFKTFQAQVVCVIGNHPDLKDLCDKFSIPFFFISTDEKTKEEFEQEVMTKIDSFSVDYIVLAKFMRILSPTFVEKYPQKIINIHHSFLPAFIGANPYKRAFERGVKLIGATAHFVTNDLDEGPIIAQQTLPVNHAFTIQDTINTGREIESAVLAKALNLVFQDKVFVYQNKTIVFDN